MRVDGGIEGLIVNNGHSPAWRPETGAQINVGHSGAWYSPTTSGQGQFLEVEPDKQFVFLGWFTYTDDPQPAESIQVGTMSIDFSDCSHALLSYSWDHEQLAGEMAISHLIPGGQALCEELSAPE